MVQVNIKRDKIFNVATVGRRMGKHKAIIYRSRLPGLTYSKQVLTAMVRTKSGGNCAVSSEFVITGLIFYPSGVES